MVDEFMKYMKIYFPFYSEVMQNFSDLESSLFLLLRIN